MNNEMLLVHIARYLGVTEGEERIELINRLRWVIAQYSPFHHHPVDHIQWIKTDRIHLNSSNPDILSPVDSRLLHLSLLRNGYTQPVVVYEKDEGYVIVDGAHSYNAGCQSAEIAGRLHGYMPVVTIREDGIRTERMMATVRHNRARGEHNVDSMSDIVRDLSRPGWSDDKIGS